MFYNQRSKIMQEAILLSKHGMDNNEGGSFGCMIEKGEVIIGRGSNKVISNNDPLHMQKLLS